MGIGGMCWRRLGMIPRLMAMNSWACGGHREGQLRTTHVHVYTCTQQVHRTLLTHANVYMYVNNIIYICHYDTCST